MADRTFAHFSDDELKTAYTQLSDALRALDRQRKALAELRQGAAFEMFMRRHATHLAAVCAAVEADPEVRADVEALRSNKGLCAAGPGLFRSEGEAAVRGWLRVTGRKRLENVGNTSKDKQLIDAVLAMTKHEKRND